MAGTFGDLVSTETYTTKEEGSKRNLRIEERFHALILRSFIIASTIWVGVDQFSKWKVQCAFNDDCAGVSDADAQYIEDACVSEDPSATAYLVVLGLSFVFLVLEVFRRVVIGRLLHASEIRCLALRKSCDKSGNWKEKTLPWKIFPWKKVDEMLGITGVEQPDSPSSRLSQLLHLKELKEYSSGNDLFTRDLNLIIEHISEREHVEKPLPEMKVRFFIERMNEIGKCVDNMMREYEFEGPNEESGEQNKKNLRASELAELHSFFESMKKGFKMLKSAFGSVPVLFELFCDVVDKFEEMKDTEITNEALSKLAELLRKEVQFVWNDLSSVDVIDIKDKYDAEVGFQFKKSDFASHSIFSICVKMQKVQLEMKDCVGSLYPLLCAQDFVNLIPEQSLNILTMQGINIAHDTCEDVTNAVDQMEEKHQTLSYIILLLLVISALVFLGICLVPVCIGDDSITGRFKCEDFSSVGNCSSLPCSSGISFVPFFTVVIVLGLFLFLSGFMCSIKTMFKSSIYLCRRFFLEMDMECDFASDAITT